MLSAPSLQLPDSEIALRRALEGRSYWQTVWDRLRRDKVTLTAMAILALIVLAAILAPVISPYSPYQGSVVNRLQPIGTPGHWLGTDEGGRDMLTRMMHGGRLSLLAGVVPVLIALLVGVSLGILAGFAGGWVNTLIMRTTDVFYAFPPVLLAVAITGTLGSGIANTIIALSITFTPPLIRITETVTTQVRTQDFVDAARASGAPVHAILRHHILSNVLGPILVYATSLISICIILASGLSFLGLGVPPPFAEWGLMLNSLRQAIWVEPMVAALPGLMIFITSMSFNLMSDGLRQAMDVRI
jgi:peptide/nickel transport system permease protein